MSELDIGKLEAEFESLTSLKTENFDPAGYAYIQGLYSRLRLVENRDNRDLHDRVSTAFLEYRERYRLQKKAASEQMSAILADFPESGREAELLFSANEFKCLERLLVQLERAQHRANRLEGLRSLIGAIDEHIDHDAEPLTEKTSFEERLDQQEQSILNIASSASCVIKGGDAKQLELQSMRLFRESTKHAHIDSLLEQAISEYPANPGPHNPHMLSVKALARMQDLSPAYLRRLGGYLETLIWLEKNSPKLVKAH